MKTSLIPHLKSWSVLTLVGAMVFLNGCEKSGIIAVTPAATERGTLDPTAAWSGAGSYTGFNASALPASKVCSSTSIFGTTGTAVCQAGSTVTAATPTDVLLGTQFWDSSGILRTGSLSTSSPTQVTVASGSQNNDAVTSVTVTATAPGLFSGFIVNLGGDFLRSNICSGKTIFGRAGTAVCNSVVADLTASNVGRSGGTAQITTSAEHSAGALPSGYREIPDIDHDYVDAAGTGSPMLSSVACGTSQSTIAARISDCLEKAGSCSNGALSTQSSCEAASATWSSTAIYDPESGVSGEGPWKLVAFDAGSGVHITQDVRTGLLWVRLGALGPVNWCAASGNKQSNGFMDCSANTTSLCAEASGLSAPAGAAILKGGLNSTSTPAVRWRLPTANDFKQADVNGRKFPVNAGEQYWMATGEGRIAGGNPADFMTFDTYFLQHHDIFSSAHEVLCVGR